MLWLIAVRCPDILHLLAVDLVIQLQYASCRPSGDPN